MNTPLPAGTLEAYGFVSLARDLHCAGREKAAEALYQQAILRIEKNLGRCHSSLTPFLDAYAAFLHAQQRAEEAALQHERSAEILAGL